MIRKIDNHLSHNKVYWKKNKNTFLKFTRTFWAWNEVKTTSRLKSKFTGSYIKKKSEFYWNGSSQVSLRAQTAPMQPFLPGQKTLFLDSYYFHWRVCVCVCRSVFIQFISKSSWPIMMKLGRMIYNDKRSIPFKDKINRFVEYHS